MDEKDQGKVERVESFWWRTEEQGAVRSSPSLTPGERCPQCDEGVLQYDSLFVLTCPRCGYVAESGGCT